MQRHPLSQQRSEWEALAHGPAESVLVAMGAHHLTIARRNVGDGVLRVCVAVEVGRWHLSISHTGHDGKLRRYPRWDEIAAARYHFIPDGVTVAMVLPPPGEYVALHDTTFHLHEWPDGPGGVTPPE